MGKTASTYLQYAFFPKLKGITYVQRTQFTQYPQLIKNSADPVVLVSNEFDRQLESETAKIARLFPNANIIIVLRRHDSWIASQYRRFIKNGCDFRFDEFLNLKEDGGFWKKEELLFLPKLHYLENLFGKPPLVLLHKDLKEDPLAFFNIIAQFLGVSYDKEDISLTPRHRSYSEKQLKAIRLCSPYKDEPKRHPNALIHFIKRKWRQIVCYSILYPSALLPESWFGNEPLINPEDLLAVKNYYREDWDSCLDYAKQHNINQSDNALSDK